MANLNPRHRRHWSNNEKIRILKEAMQDGITFTSVANKYKIPATQLHAWKRRIHPNELEHGNTVKQYKDDSSIINNVDPATLDVRLTVTFRFEFV